MVEPSWIPRNISTCCSTFICPLTGTSSSKTLWGVHKFWGRALFVFLGIVIGARQFSIHSEWHFKILGARSSWCSCNCARKSWIKEEQYWKSSTTGHRKFENVFSVLLFCGDNRQYQAKARTVIPAESLSEEDIGKAFAQALPLNEALVWDRWRKCRF